MERCGSMKKPDKRTPFGTLLVRTDWHPETADARQKVTLLRAELQGLVGSCSSGCYPSHANVWFCSYCDNAVRGWQGGEYPHEASCPITLGRAALEETK